MTRIAVVGSGISGLSAAWELRRDTNVQVSLFEAGSYFGGHTHTVDVTLPDARGQLTTHGVDTGFLVFNERTYPALIRLFAELRVHTVASDMSFSVQSRGMEWSGSSLDTVFAQRRNLLRPGFWRMLRDVNRFNRVATALAASMSDERLEQPIGDFLREHAFGAEFRDWYFLPMIACIWSCPTEQMLAFPVATLLRFCHNHGLLQVTNRPQWFTVAGGARHYVDRLLKDIPDARLNTPVLALRRHDKGVDVYSSRGIETFDALVLACHSDQALQLLGEQASTVERSVLSAIGYHANRAVLHTDTSLLPQRRKAWAAWNYEHGHDAQRERSAVCLHYLINQLQPLPFAQSVIVSLNPAREPDPAQVLAEFDYAHPVFDQAAISAQGLVPQLQGGRRTWFCGAWTGYGFHEDGLKSGLAVAASLRQCTWYGQAPQGVSGQPAGGARA